MLLAQFFTMLESMDTPEWPQCLLLVAITLISKGEGRLPLQQRTLAVFSVFYRAWAGLRYYHLRLWQESWADPAITGGRMRCEALDAAWELGLDLEEAHLSGTDLLVLFLHYSILFDMFSMVLIGG